MPTLLLTLIITCGCNDPVLEAAREGGAAPSEAPARGASEGATHPIDGGRAGAHSSAGGVGVPEEPAPGDPGTPPPGEPGEPGPGIPDEPDPVLPAGGSGRVPPPVEGPTVTVSGTVELSDWVQGPIRIDVFDGDQLQLGGPRPGVVTKLTLDEPGPFTVEVPEAVGHIWLSAFNDEDRDGRPGPVDPTGYFQQNPVSVEDGAVEGISIVLERRDPPGGAVDEGL